MKYSTDFIERCKKYYPEWIELHRLLDNGNTYVGRILEDSSPNSISLEAVLNAKNLDELQLKANEYKARLALWREWVALYEAELAQKHE